MFSREYNIQNFAYMHRIAYLFIFNMGGQKYTQLIILH